MSEENLRRFLERFNEDEGFRETLKRDPNGAFVEFGLSAAEQAAVTSADEDALRRLAGPDVSGYLAAKPSTYYFPACFPTYFGGCFTRTCTIV